MAVNRSLTLALETAVGGGSLSILDGFTEVDFWVGSRTISKAEDVLENIENLLDKNRLRRSDLRLLATASEPGSATGLKIGTATALGLAKALGIQTKSFSLFHAIETQITFAENGETVLALPGGRNNILRRIYTRRAAETNVSLISKDAFDEYCQRVEVRKVFAHQDIITESIAPFADKFTNLGGNMAKFIGLDIARLITN